MAFTSMVNSESREEIEKFDRSQEKSENEHDINKAFDYLFEECLKLKKVNSSAYKKLHKLKLEKQIALR